MNINESLLYKSLRSQLQIWIAWFYRNYPVIIIIVGLPVLLVVVVSSNLRPTNLRVLGVDKPEVSAFVDLTTGGGQLDDGSINERAVLSRLNYADLMIPTTRELSTVGINQGSVVMDLVDNGSEPFTGFWDKLEQDGVGYVLGIAYDPSHATDAGEFVKRAYEHEMIPIVRLCAGSDACGFKGAKGNDESLREAGKLVGQFCLNVQKQAEGRSFICTLGPNEPAFEAQFWVSGAGSGPDMDGEDWRSLGVLMNAAFDHVRSAIPDSVNDPKKIMLATGAFNVGNPEVDEVNELFRHIRDKNGRCRQWDYFLANAYNLPDSTYDASRRIVWPYIKGFQSVGERDLEPGVLEDSLAYHSEECGVPVIFTEVGFIDRDSNLSFCTEEDPAVRGEGLYRFYEHIEPLRTELEQLLRRNEVEAALLYRPYGRINERFYSGDEVDVDRSDVVCEHVVTTPELTYLTAQFGGDSDKNNDYIACTYEHEYNDIAEIETPDMLRVGGTRDNIRLKVACEPGAKGIACNAKSYDTIEVSAPIKALGLNSPSGTIINQYLSACGLLNYYGVNMTPEGEEDPILFDNLHQAATPIKVEDHDYPLPWLDSARNCSEFLRANLPFNVNEFQSEEHYLDETEAEISGAASFTEYDAPGVGTKDSGSFGMVELADDIEDQKNRTTSFYFNIGRPDRTPRWGTVRSDSILVRDLTGLDPYSYYSEDRALLSQVPNSDKIDIAVYNEDLMLPGPEMKIGEDEVGWGNGGIVCWDAIVHRNGGGSGDVISKAIHGDNMQPFCTWVGNLDTPECEFTGLQDYLEAKRSRARDDRRRISQLVKEECYIYEGENQYAHQLESDFGEPKLNGSITIPGLRDITANLIKVAEYKLETVFNSTGFSRDFIFNYPDKALPIEVKLKVRDENRGRTSVTSRGDSESFYYENDNCTLPNGADSYYDYDHHIAWNGEDTYVTYSSELYYINRLLELLTYMFPEGSDVYNAVVEFPDILEVGPTTQQQIINQYESANNSVLTTQHITRCPDINGSYLDGVIPLLGDIDGVPMDEMFKYFDCFIGWSDEQIRVDANYLYADICTQSNSAYSDGQFLDCDALCPDDPTVLAQVARYQTFGAGAANAGRSLSSLTASGSAALNGSYASAVSGSAGSSGSSGSSGAGRPTVDSGTLVVSDGATCPVVNGRCVQGPGGSLSHNNGSTRGATDLNGSGILVAPEDGEVIWAATGFEYTYCANGTKAGGGVVFKPDSGGDNLYIYHVNVHGAGGVDAVLGRYEVGEVIAGLSDVGDATVDPAVWVGGVNVGGCLFDNQHAHIALTSGICTSGSCFDTSDKSKYLMEAYGCSMSPAYDHCGTEAGRYDIQVGSPDDDPDDVDDPDDNDDDDDPVSSAAFVSQDVNTLSAGSGTTTAGTASQPITSTVGTSAGGLTAGYPAYCYQQIDCTPYISAMNSGLATPSPSSVSVPDVNIDLPDGAFVAPLDSLAQSDRFGSYNASLRGSTYHTGLDFAIPEGSSVYAVADGVVANITVLNRWYGNFIEIDHGDFATGYGHLSQILVEAGDTVQAGQLIGLSGNTGNSTGPHLHFDMSRRPLGTARGPSTLADLTRDFIDPAPYIDGATSNPNAVDPSDLPQISGGGTRPLASQLAFDYCYDVLSGSVTPQAPAFSGNNSPASGVDPADPQGSSTGDLPSPIPPSGVSSGFDATPTSWNMNDIPSSVKDDVDYRDLLNMCSPEDIGWIPGLTVDELMDIFANSSLRHRVGTDNRRAYVRERLGQILEEAERRDFNPAFLITLWVTEGGSWGRYSAGANNSLVPDGHLPTGFDFGCGVKSLDCGIIGSVPEDAPEDEKIEAAEDGFYRSLACFFDEYPGCGAVCDPRLIPSGQAHDVRGGVVQGPGLGGYLDCYGPWSDNSVDFYKAFEYVFDLIFPPGTPGGRVDDGTCVIDLNHDPNG